MERVNGREREGRGKSVIELIFLRSPQLQAKKGAIYFLYLMSEIRTVS